MLKYMPKPYTIAILEVGEDYIDRLITIKADRCSLEEAKKEAREAGYQVIDECCHVVHTTHEVHVIVAVEPEGGYDMNMTIKTWYAQAYPTDDVGLTLDPAVTFADLYHALQAGKCVYATLGGNADSIVRERVFAALADFLDVDSGHIYNLWLNKKRRC